MIATLGKVLLLLAAVALSGGTERRRRSSSTRTRASRGSTSQSPQPEPGPERPPPVTTMRRRIPASARNKNVRLVKELADFATGKHRECLLTAELIDPSNMYRWKASFVAPEGTPLAGKTLWLEISDLDQYPGRPPTVKFTSRIFHPNVNHEGKICVDFLKDSTAWSSTYTIDKILLSISSLYAEPNPDDPWNGYANELYKRKRGAYNTKARAIFNGTSHDFYSN